MEVRVPGDKSISQRGLIFAALAEGTSRLRGLLTSHDPRSAAEVLRGLSVSIPDLRHDEIVIQGQGLRGLVAPTSDALDCGNSGTCARLMLGVLAGQTGTATLTGDASLRSRPMDRVFTPLRDMGAQVDELNGAGRLPARIRGGSLQSLDLASPVASAQVKSAVLLAGVTGGAPVRVSEPGRSRDHTERLLRSLGVPLHEADQEGRWVVTLAEPPDRLPPMDLQVPADLSSAAFFMVLAALGGAGPELVLPDVGLNPTRTGILPALERMGAELERVDVRDSGGGEPVGTVIARPSGLRAVEIGPPEVPSLIDEIPILAVAAARAEGVTRIRGASELRVKESDRIAALASNLRAVGVVVEERPDGLEIQGGDQPLEGRVSSFGDHRIAMAFGVLGALEGNRIEMVDGAAAEVSFPGFWTVLERAGSHG